ncbi:MAG: sensor histidine kinase [Deltaproteobacteria bacterium]|nr:sensor histidine kinase [Deltaproteobacteria bacterium]
MNQASLRVFNKIVPLLLRGRLTVTQRITLWYLLLSIAPILAIGFLAYQNSRASLEGEIINKLSAVADDKALLLNDQIQDKLVEAKRLASNPGLKGLLSPVFRIRLPHLVAKTPEERTQKAKDLITSLQASTPYYVDILIVDKEGKIVLSSFKAWSQEGKMLSEIGLPKLEMDQAFVSPVFFSPIAQRHVFLIASPVSDHEGNVVGLAALEVELKRIQQLIGGRSGLGETGEVMIMDRNLRMLTQSRFTDESIVLKTIPGNNAIQQGLQGNKGEMFYRDYRGVSVLGAYRPLTVMDAVLIAKIDEAEGFSPVVKLRNTVLIIIVLTMGLAAWVATWVARVTTRPIWEADALEKLRADFTAMIIHDLRSPLTALLSSVAILQDGLAGPLSAEQKEWLSKIDVGTRNLLNLVNGFLDLSKLEEGRIELASEDVDLRQLIQNSLDHYSVLARDKKISFKCRVDPALPLISVDPRRLAQVFSNLLSNAIKFTAEGGEIEVGASRANGNEAKVWVKDNGMGIPSQEIGELFQKYRQTTSGKSSKEKGTGLGLVICKMIVEAHGGKIWVESKEGKGTTFSFSLPLG